MTEINKRMETDRIINKRMEINKLKNKTIGKIKTIKAEIGSLKTKINQRQRTVDHPLGCVASKIIETHNRKEVAVKLLLIQVNEIITNVVAEVATETISKKKL
jgi:hypothetical protein